MLDNIPLSSVTDPQPESPSLLSTVWNHTAQVWSHTASLTASNAEYIEAGLEACAIGVAALAISRVGGRTIASETVSAASDAAEAIEQKIDLHVMPMPWKRTSGLNRLPLELQEKVIPAAPRDYEFWLKNYLAEGGKVTDVYSYDLPDNFFRAKAGFEMPNLYGSKAFNVIVPKQLDISVEGGHSTLYKMDPFRTEGLHFVPLYRDTLRGEMQAERDAAEASSRRK